MTILPESSKMKDKFSFINDSSAPRLSNFKQYKALWTDTRKVAEATSKKLLESKDQSSSKYDLVLMWDLIGTLHRLL
jgi:hypothetical protein